MDILRKIRTAAMVLRRFGPREAFGLLCDNAVKLNFYLVRFFSGLLRKAFSPLISRMPRRSAKLRILYVTTDFEAFHSQTVRYRIRNFREALRGAASTRFEVFEGGIYKNERLLSWADVIVLMRTTWTRKVGLLIGSAERLGIPVVFDIDDIIFLPQYAEDYCRVLGDTSRENVELRRAEFEGFEKTFKRCRYATASTHFISEKMERAGKRAFVIHNGLNKRQIAIAERACGSVPGVRAIGYLSGTKTHDRDFACALPALSKIVAEYPDVILRVAGYLDLSALPPALAQKTQPACYMRWGRLMKYGAQNYINIAPLDISNPFCHAKSELKYFEAAAAGVPTVASSTDTFTRCIRDGDNGLLASDDEMWYAALKRLLDDKDFYSRIAESARRDALEHYSPAATAKEALAAYSAIAADYRGTQKRRPT